MKVKSINIENYKGFEQIKIDFHPRINVFIGSNASGKTSLLTAILKTLYNVTTTFAKPAKQIKQLQLTSEDVNYKSGICSIASIIDDFPGYHRTIPSLVINAIEGKKKNVNFEAMDDLLKKFLNWYEEICSNSTTTVPIIKFYPANRGAIDYVDEQKQKNYLISQLETWANIYQDSLSYSRFFNWFLENETNELLLQRDNQNFEIQSPALKDIRRALSKAFEMMGYPDLKIKTKQIQRKHNSKLTPALVLEDGLGKNEFIDNKSDGEKAIITLIADIAYNLSLAKDFVTNDDFLNSPGIVLIDEIETHLHPNWQRQILMILTTIFPNIQFFVATHSPQVVSSVASESVFICENFRITRINLKTKGEDTNSLLKYVFQATDRPQKYIELLERFDQLMNESATYKELEAIIGKVSDIDREDDSTSISNLIEEMNLQLSAYKFEKEHETHS